MPPAVPSPPPSPATSPPPHAEPPHAGPPHAEPPHAELPRRLAALITGGSLALACVLLFSKTMQRSLDHDEHQFVASAALLARQGLLPYRDVPHFHAPYLVFADGLLFRLTDHLLLAARLLSVACAAGLLLLVQRVTLRLFAPHGPLSSALAGAAALGLLLFSPLFAYTTGLAWNHDAAVLPATAAVALLALRAGSGKAALGAGLLLGLATGVRLSALPLAAPLLLLAWCGPREGRTRRALLFGTGAALALLPALLLALADPAAAWFGNVAYAATNTGWRARTGFEGPMTLPQKMADLAGHLARPPGHLALFAALAAGLLLRRRDRPLRPVAAPLLALPFAALGALAPTPSWPQYFYALVPLLLLATVAALGQADATRARRAAALATLALAAAVAAAAGLREYRTLGNLATPAAWTPVRVHDAGRRLRQHLPDGATVVTLSPLFALEGGLSIPPAFAPGPFGFRSAPLLTADERRRFGLVGPTELDALFAPDAPDAPDALHVGHERHGDDLLAAWAAARGLRRLDLGDDGALYVPSTR